MKQFTVNNPAFAGMTDINYIVKKFLWYIEFSTTVQNNFEMKNNL